MSSLPLTNNAEENFNVVISDKIYSCRQLWNTIGFWTLDIRDENGVALITGVVLVAQSRLLRQYPQVRFDLISAALADPTRNNLDVFNLEVVDKDA